jgi:radical SAM protein with 4Fe4S-binding SPASM domain
MSYETAVKSIDRHLSSMEKETSVRIEFFGGEALLRFELLKQIYEYTQKQYPQLHIHYAFTTNGTLMHGAIKTWFETNGKDFSCTLSLDGTEEMHNSNRLMADGHTSYDQIDTDFFLHIWPHCIAKMTISDRTLPHMAEGIMAIEKAGFWCKATFASGISWDTDEIKAILVEQLNKLVAYYSDNEQKLCMLFDLDLRAIFNSSDVPFRYCEAGIEKVCYDPLGRAYPCQGLASTSVGEENATLFEEECFENFMISKDNPCRTCKWLRVCRTCYAANYLETGSIERNNKNTCYLNRMTILASSAIQYRRIEKCAQRTLEQKQTVMAIAEIQKNILAEYGLNGDK